MEMLLRKNRFLLSTVLSVLLCSSLILCVKAEAVMWFQTYGGPDNDYAYSLVASSDGGYALAGTTETGLASGDFWLVKTNALGNMEWNQTYGGTGYDRGASVVYASDGGYTLLGGTESFGVGGVDFWLVKTDGFGNMEWNQTYGGAGDEYASSLIETSDGGYALAGSWNYSINIVTPSFGDFWLVKTNATGVMEWNQTYGGEDWEEIRSLVATSDGGYALAGGTYYWDGFNNPDFLLVKTDEYGVAPLVPEASLVVLPLLLTATLIIFISKKKLLHQPSKEK